MGYIYKISNDVNDKVYIGKTETGVEQRFREHCRDSRKERCERRPLYAAMRKHGADRFAIEVIEECPSEMLAARESFWISHYGSYQYGYNATQGGDGTTRFPREEILSRLLECPYTIRVAREFGCDVSLVRSIARANNIPVRSEYRERASKERGRQVLQFSLDGTYLQTFDSFADALKWCYENGHCKVLSSSNKNHISECAREKRKSAYGFVWRTPV